MSQTSKNQALLKLKAIEPLYASWEEPNAHRIRAEGKDGVAQVEKGRRHSSIVISQNLRGAVHEWRDLSYYDLSETTSQLLEHWFGRSHRKESEDGDYEFRYYYCQREAIETLIYLKEVRNINSLSQLIAEFGGPDSETAALGVIDDEDAWNRNAFKMATGTGKTKVMSLAIVWSYFHALRESDSDMAKHFVVIAPNLTVFERLKDDFGNGKVFDEDPLIPVEWKGDWNLSTVLQDEVGGAVTGGTLYLTNIHRLYDLSKRRTKQDAETYPWMGPKVSKAKALDTGAALRDKITSHKNIMVLNDEAHHLWDPGSAWNEAIQYLHDTIIKRGGGGIELQLDFSATPKDNKGLLFKHIICDSPLGEAVDGGIVKTPVIGRASKELTIEPSEDAAHRFDRHLRLGYERWKISKEEWEKSGKKALLFVMCEDTEAADQITNRLNTEETFKELNGKTINLHTNLKGKIKKVGSGANAKLEFVVNEKQISDDDLKALRKLSRELDNNSSQYLCIVSVLMLREGWDVRNVTTIIPLRAYSSIANILPEQTLGRGLRRMIPNSQDGLNEIVTVVEHPAFASLYQQELAQEGVQIEIIDIDRVPSTTISIFPDEKRKDVAFLEIGIPKLSAGHKTLSKLEGLTIEDIKQSFNNYKPIPLGSKGAEKVEYEGRHLFTNEVIEKMEIHLPLLESGVGAITYFVKQMESICKIRNLHTDIASLLETFLQEILFDKKTTLYEPALIARLGDGDVAEHVRAVFVPLIRARITTIEKRAAAGKSTKMSSWKTFQVTHSERHPAIEAKKTLFNLVPCNRELEVAMTKFLDRASDVNAFAKNASHQSLRIDYLARGSHLSFYTPDFFVKTNDGNYYLIETKGREDRDVPLKAKAALAWCRSASTKKIKWEYLYVLQGVFERSTGESLSELVSLCQPSFQELLRDVEDDTQTSILPTLYDEEGADLEIEGIIENSVLESLPPRYMKAVKDAIFFYRILENKQGMNYSTVFQPMLGSLDEAAKGLIIRRLKPEMPSNFQDQRLWFDPYMDTLSSRNRNSYQKTGKNLLKTLVYNNGISPIGLLRNCIDFALNEPEEIEGVFLAIKSEFGGGGNKDLLNIAQSVNTFRNTYVAHQDKELTDIEESLKNLKLWIEALTAFSEA